MLRLGRERVHLCWLDLNFLDFWDCRELVLFIFMIVCASKLKSMLFRLWLSWYLLPTPLILTKYSVNLLIYSYVQRIRLAVAKKPEILRSNANVQKRSERICTPYQTIPARHPITIKIRSNSVHESRYEQRSKFITKRVHKSSIFRIINWV